MKTTKLEHFDLIQHRQGSLSDCKVPKRMLKNYCARSEGVKYPLKMLIYNL